MNSSPHAPDLPWLEYACGDPAALEEVYRAHVGEVSMLLRRGFTYTRGKVARIPGVSDEATRLDLIQDTFVRAFTHKARRAYDPEKPFSPYLLRIAKNLMIDRLRKSGREVELPQSEEMDLLDEDPASRAHWFRQRQETKSWINSLPEEIQTFFRLRYEDEKAQVSVAQELGISRRRVRTLEKHLRKGLRKHLKNKGLWP